jgi:radical SAM protein (TIGR01212 family)
MPDSRMRRHAEALKARHGDRVWRIGLDGGFSCPNRPLGRGSGGCAYCAPDAGRAPYLPEGRSSIEEQVGVGIAFLERRYGARLFFPYFQAYSSTFAAPAELRRRYDEALRVTGERAPGGLRGLVVSTRPDCLDGEKAALLASYAARGLEVWVELGLQSSHDGTLSRIRRGHDYACFVRALETLRAAGSRAAPLRAAVHLILGLPGETEEDMLETVSRIASLGIDGVKFHDLLLPEGSALASEYLAGELTLMHPSKLPSLLADCLELLDPACEVVRLRSDAPSRGILAPRLRPDKAQLYRAVEDELESRGSRQGLRRGSGSASSET